MMAFVFYYIVDLSFALMIGSWVLSTGSARVIEESNLSSICIVCDQSNEILKKMKLTKSVVTKVRSEQSD